jgi:hypothetical protein
MKIARAWFLGVSLWGSFSLMMSCGGKSHVDGTDSHTHWLKECERDAECAGLSCICGVCTKACDEGDDCNSFRADAACEVPAGCDARGPTACVLPRPSGGGGVSGGGSANSGGSSTSGGGSSGSGGTPAAVDCAAMDAASSGTLCLRTLGYSWNGSVCSPVVCGCVGSQCDELFTTADECDRAYRSCYAERGIGRACTTHGDCVVQTRLCCEPCSAAADPQDVLIATTSDSPTLRNAGICLGDPEGGCDDCVGAIHRGAYASCVEGECRLLDVTDQAKCETVEDCRFVTKDCCPCGGDFTGAGLLAVDASFTLPEYCPADQACPECEGDMPSGALLACDDGVGTCWVGVLPR